MLTNLMVEETTKKNQTSIIPQATQTQADTIVRIDDIQLFPMLSMTIDGKLKYGYVDKQGNWMIKPIYDDFDRFSEGLARVKLGEKYGFIDKKGNWVIQPIYDKVGVVFIDDLLFVVKNTEAFYINKQGEVVIKPKPYHP